MARLPIDELRNVRPPASPLVEATLALIHEQVRAAYGESGQDWAAFSAGGDVPTLGQGNFAEVERQLLASGHCFDWSAAISVAERPEAYKPSGDAAASDEGFAHAEAPSEEPDAEGRALCGVGDNVVRHERDVEGVARYIRSNDRVLRYLTDGVPPGTIAVIDDSGGTLTAPIIEHFAGVICAGGTVRSHLGILTREYNIPCVMNAKVAHLREGDRVRIETSAAAKTTEDYQQGIERVAKIWRLDGERA